MKCNSFQFTNTINIQSSKKAAQSCQQELEEEQVRHERVQVTFELQHAAAQEGDDVVRAGSGNRFEELRPLVSRRYQPEAVARHDEGAVACFLHASIVDRDQRILISAADHEGRLQMPCETWQPRIAGLAGDEF